MRPRHKAAENRRVEPAAARHLPGASMRPRHKAAENRIAGDLGAGADGHASMRPRHKAAENPGASFGSRRATGASFNEAAA